MSDTVTALQLFLIQFSAAIKSSTFYPAQHPNVRTTVGAALGRLREVLGQHAALTIGVGDGVFFHEELEIGGDSHVISTLATYFRRRRVGQLVFEAHVDREALLGLLEVIRLAPATLRSRGGAAHCIAEKRLIAVSMIEFDPAESLKLTRATTSKVGDDTQGQARALTFKELASLYFVGVDAKAPPGTNTMIMEAASEEQAARELIRGIHAVVGTAGLRGAQRFATALGRVAADVIAEDRNALSPLAANLGAALGVLDPTSQMDVLQSSIPIPGSDIDLASEIRDRIPEDRLAEMIVTLVKSEGKITPRLATVVRKVLIDTGRLEGSRAEIRRAIEGARGSGTDPLAEIWTSIERLLEEKQDEWLSEDYKTVLEAVGHSKPTVDKDLRCEIMALPEYVDALTEEGTRRRAWQIFADLIQLDTTPAHVCEGLTCIEQRAVQIAPSWFRPAVDVAATLHTLLDCEPVADVREATQKALQGISAGVVSCYRDGFHGMATRHHEECAQLLEVLGLHAVEALIEGLRNEEDWEIRKNFIAFLIARGKDAVDSLLCHLNDSSWYMKRNVLLILGEIGDPSSIKAIAEILKHPNARFRAEAVSALGNIGGPRVFALVAECMDDPEIGEVATQCLATMNRSRTISTLLQMTQKISVFGGRNSRLQEVVKTLGALGAHESIPHLQTILMRKLWVPPSSGDTVRIASALALENIGTPGAWQAVEGGTRLWRHSVRSACEAIVAGRHK